MPRFLFRGAFIRFCDLRYDEKSKTVYTKINVTAEFSEPIREAMEWGEVPAGFQSAKLDGEYNATNLVLTPNGRELKQHEMQLNAKDIGGFHLFRVSGDSDDSTKNELRFQVLTADPDAAAKVREYLSVVGKGAAQLRVNYEAQSELEMEAESKGDAEERLISDEQAADTAAADEGATLASATLMSGTHQKGARQKRRAEPVQ